MTLFITHYSDVKISKLRVTGLCVANSLVTDEFPAQKASNGENVSIWWRHHAITYSPFCYVGGRGARGGGVVCVCVCVCVWGGGGGGGGWKMGVGRGLDGRGREPKNLNFGRGYQKKNREKRGREGKIGRG